MQNWSCEGAILCAGKNSADCVSLHRNFELHYVQAA